MSDQCTKDYYTRRAECANRLAAAAAEPGIRKIHLEMARTYERKVAEATPPARRTLSVAIG